MAKVEEVGFGVGHALHGDANDLVRVVDELADVDEEIREIEFLLHKLARRRDRLDRRFAELVELRDRLEAGAWERQVEHMRAVRLALLEGPKPPSISEVSTRAADPAPEPWDVDDAESPVPQWVSPAKTWPIPMPGLMPSRAAPRRRSATRARPQRRPRR